MVERILMKAPHQRWHNSLETTFELRKKCVLIKLIQEGQAYAEALAAHRSAGFGWPPPLYLPPMRRPWHHFSIDNTDLSK